VSLPLVAGKTLAGFGSTLHATPGTSLLFTDAGIPVSIVAWLTLSPRLMQQHYLSLRIGNPNLLLDGAALE